MPETIGLDVPARTIRNKIGLWLGPLLALAIQLIPLPASLIESAGSVEAARDAWIVFSLLVLMAVWWVSETVPIPVTSLLPIVILPFFGVLPLKPVAGEYLHPIVVLLLGGFIIAKAIERWNLHARIALGTVSVVGSRPSLLVAGFMVAGAVLSMWISNTATSIMMMPIAISVAAAVLGKDNLNQNFTYALLLGIAYACSIGGLGTPIGTPTNLIIIGHLNNSAGFDVGFVDWMMLGIPTVLVLLPLAWFVVTRWAFPIRVKSAERGQELIRQQLRELGPISVPEWRVIGVFAVIAGLWVGGQWLKEIEIGGVVPFGGMTDHIVAIFGVILCFLVPAGDKTQPEERLLDWPTAESIPWGVVLLFGGGMSLAAAITATGLSAWMGSALSGLSALHLVVVILIITTFVIFLTEVTSNVATASALMPVVGAFALATGMPIERLAAPLAMAASCAFMLPMATGPNAVVHATGRVTLPQMAAAGIRLNLLCIVAIVGLAYYLAPFAFAN